MNRSVLILGMHRSGTSCLARMLAAAGASPPGDSVRNWDNARGHFEALELVRLDDDVLAESGGHWLAPPRDVRWTSEHEHERDRLLAATVDGRPALLKDPRALLCLPFWRASRVPFHSIGVVRHPLAVARSLAAWRGMPFDDALASWCAHNGALLADVRAQGGVVVDFELPRRAFVEAVASACASFGWSFDERELAAAYEAQLVHHTSEPARASALLDEALALYAELAALAREWKASHAHVVGSARAKGANHEATVLDASGIGAGSAPSANALDAQRRLGEVVARLARDDSGASWTKSAADVLDACERRDGGGSARAACAFPYAPMASFDGALARSDIAGATRDALAALQAASDASAVAVPVVNALLRVGAHDAALEIARAAESRLERGLADLVLGKVHLARGDVANAVERLSAAVASDAPYFQARVLLPQALRASGRLDDARRAQRELARASLYPHGPLAQLAEWAWIDGDRAAALATMSEAITAAPKRRRGRLRTRRAEWLVARGDVEDARAELETAVEEDPQYARAASELAKLARTAPNATAGVAAEVAWASQGAPLLSDTEHASGSTLPTSDVEHANAPASPRSVAGVTPQPALPRDEPPRPSELESQAAPPQVSPDSLRRSAPPADP